MQNQQVKNGALPRVFEKLPYFMQRGEITNELFLVLFLIGPMFSATTDWAFLFYFDRKRMRSSEFSKMMDYYNRAVGQTAIFFALGYWLLATALTFLFISTDTIWYLVLLLPLFIAKAKLANFQIMRFSYNAYFDIIFSNMLIMVIFIIAYYIHVLFPLKYFLIILSFIIAIKILQKQRFRSIHDEKTLKLPISLYNFLTRLLHVANRNLTLYYITSANGIHAQQEFYLMETLLKNFVDTEEEICAVDAKRYVFYTLDREFSEFEIIEASSGFIKSVTKKKIICAAQLISLLHNRQDIFSDFLPKTFFDSHTKLSHHEIKNRFLHFFPQGICFSPLPELGSKALSMKREDMRNLYMQAIEYLFHSQNERYSQYDTTVCFSKGRIEYIFSVPKMAYDESKFKRWRHFCMIKTLSMRQLLYKHTQSLC